MNKPKSIFKRIISIVSTLIFLLIIALMVSVVYTTSKQKVPQFFSYSILRVISPSMTPEIPVGSYILIKKVDPKELKEGDIISFYSTDPLIYMKPNTHRIVEIKNENGKLSFITKGDANAVNDAAVASDSNLIGVYKGRLKWMDQIGKIFTNPVSFLFIVLIPALIIFMMEIRNVVKKAREDDDKRVSEKTQEK